MFFLKNASLSKLLRETKRDNKWQNNFLNLIEKAKLEIAKPESLHGPDYFPYLGFSTEGDGKLSLLSELDNAIHECKGIVINPQKPRPDWFFPVGSLVARKNYGEFYIKHEPRGRFEKTLNKDEEVLVASPSESILPSSVRREIKSLLEDLGYSKIQIRYQAQLGQSASQFVMFKLPQELLQSKERTDFIMTKICWYLPGQCPPGLNLNNSDGPWFDL